MKKQIVLITTLAIIWTLSFVSCDSDDSPPIVDDPTITIDASSFANFDTWALVKTAEGTDPSGFLGQAHNGGLIESIRKVYIKDDQSAIDGVFPAGTIIVKHTSTLDGLMTSYQAMVKRESGFNSEDSDWEWFIIEADGTIVDRGPSLNNNGCANCHGNATTDLVFSK